MKSLNDGTRSYTDEELIELGRSALLAESIKEDKPPSVWKKAWDEVKEPWSVVLIFVAIIMTFIGNFALALFFGKWIQTITDSGMGVGISAMFFGIMVSVAFWWYVVVVVSVIIKEEKDDE